MYVSEEWDFFFVHDVMGVSHDGTTCLLLPWNRDDDDVEDINLLMVFRCIKSSSRPSEI